MYHLPHVCRTLLPEIRVCLEKLCVFRHIDKVDVVHVCDSHDSEDQSYSLSAVKIFNKDMYM